MKSYSVVPLLSGLLFGAGMAFSGMVNPEKVIAFLDVAGDWKIDLAFVMGGALLVFTPMFHFVIKKGNTALDGTKFGFNTTNIIDKKLIVGACFFGVGWGLAGVCPGPALASVSTLNLSLLAFIIAMIIGSKVAQQLQNK